MRRQSRSSRGGESVMKGARTPPPRERPYDEAEHDDPNKTGAPDDGRRDARRLHHSLAAFGNDVVLSQVLDDRRRRARPNAFQLSS